MLIIIALEVVFLNITFIEFTDNEKQLIDMMYSSIFEIKPIQYVNQKIGVEMFDADFNFVRKHIKYNDEDDFLTITLPYLDERENEELQMQLFTNQRNDVLPIVNYFIYVFGKVIRQSMGLVEIQFIGQHIKRNDNDFKFDRFEHQFRESEYMYYDYETKKYIQINSEDLRNARNSLKKGKSIDDCSQEIKTYLEREEMLKQGKLALKGVGNKFLRTVVDMRSKRSRKGASTTSYKEYLNTYNSFLKALEYGLKIHLVFENISDREYLKLEEKRKELINLIDQLKKDIELLSQKINTSGRYKTDADDMTNLGLQIIKDTEEYGLHNKMIDGFKVLEEFLTAHTDGSYNSSGYFDWDFDLWELYPNIIQIEKRRNLTVESTNYGKERELQNKILKGLQKKSSENF